MVMTFNLTPLSHYNSITEPHAHFLLSLLEDSLSTSLLISSHLFLICIWIRVHVISSFSLWLSRVSSDTSPSPFLILLISLPWVPSVLVLFCGVRPNFDRSGHEWRRMILLLLLFLPHSRLLPPLLILFSSWCDPKGHHGVALNNRCSS